MNSSTTDSYMRPRVHATMNMPITAVRMLTVLFTLLVYAVLSIGWITNSQVLAVYTFMLLGHLYVETKTLWTSETHLFWLNPVVLASIFTFVLAFGVTNILFYMPEVMVALVGLEPIVTPWMNQLMLLVVISGCAMWLGYTSSLGRSLGRMLQLNSLLRRWMTSSVRVRMVPVLLFLAISLIARLTQINLGVYGYSSTYDQLIEFADFSEYLFMAESLGKLALVGVAIQCYASSHPTLVDRMLLWLVVGYEVAFGFLSGFKSRVVIPFIIVGFVYYSQRHRFPRWLIPAVLAGVIAAYAVVEPFRATRQADFSFEGTSLDGIVAAMPSLNSITAGAGAERAPTWLSALSRMNMTYWGSLGFEYMADNQLPEGSPEFLNNIILAPAHALVPRFLWDSKAILNTGLWYTNEVVGLDIYSSTAMSPFTYLHFAGGPLAVILGFLIVGILQRGLFDGFRHYGGGGLIVLLGLLGTLGNIDSAFDTFFVAIIRYLPVLIVAQHMLLQRPRQL